jgi:hypothetical protein
VVKKLLVFGPEANGRLPAVGDCPGTAEISAIAAIPTSPDRMMIRMEALVQILSDR